MFMQIQGGDYAINLNHLVSIDFEGKNEITLHMLDGMEFTVENVKEIETLLRLTGLMS